MTPDAPAPKTLALVPRPWRPGAAFAFTAIVLWVNLASSFGVRAVVARDLPDALTALLIGACLIAGYLVTLGIVWRVAASNGIGFARSVGLRRPRNTSPAAWIVAALAGAGMARLFALLYSVAVTASRVRLPGVDSGPVSLFPGGPVSDAVLLVVAVLIAPLAEEIVFRGVVLPALGARWGAPMAVLGSSVIFALFHVNAFIFVPILFASVIFGWLFVRFESLWPAYLCHAAFNLVAVAVSLALRAGGVV